MNIVILNKLFSPDEKNLFLKNTGYEVLSVPRESWLGNHGGRELVVYMEYKARREDIENNAWLDADLVFNAELSKLIIQLPLILKKGGVYDFNYSDPGTCCRTDTGCIRDTDHGCNQE